MDKYEDDAHIASAFISWHTEEPSSPGDWEPMTEQEASEHFWGWLAAHDATVKAEAWDEGYEAGFDDGEADAFNHVTFDEPCIETPNPYRADRIEGER